MATFTGDKESIGNINEEYDLIDEAIRELGWYYRGLPPCKRQQLGTLDSKGHGRYIFVWKGKKYIYFRVRPRPEPEEGWHRWGWHCRFICGTNWRRPHFTCLRGCWGNRIWYGKMPPVFRFNHLNVIIIKNRPLWKRLLAKPVCSVLEWLTS